MAQFRSLDLLWEVPLGVLSWLFYRLTNVTLGALVRVFLRLRPAQPVEWRLLSAETIAKPLMLPIIMTSAPRWNPHALIASVGPFQAERSLGVDAAAAFRSAGTWTVVIHRFPGSRIIGSVGSQDATPNDGWASFDVEPGSYVLALRYYRLSDTVVLPAVRADGVTVAAAQPTSADVNEHLYRSLQQRRSLVFLALHSYIYTLLRLRHWLPRAFVERELLPIGNPETRFTYGHLPAGSSLNLSLGESILTGHDVYLTLYGRDSFPIHWQRIVAPEYQAGPLDHSGFYLLRIHRTDPNAQRLDPATVRLTIDEPGSPTGRSRH